MINCIFENCYFFLIKKKHSKEKRGALSMLQNLRVSQQETPRPPLTLLTFWPLTVDLSVFLGFFFPPRLGFMSLVVSKTPENSVFLNIFFRLQQPTQFFSLQGEKKHLGVLNVPLVVGSTVNEPMEVGGLEWLQEPFQPRSSGSSGLCFFFGSGENWEDLSSLERQKEFKVTWFWTSILIQKMAHTPPTKNQQDGLSVTLFVSCYLLNYQWSFRTWNDMFFLAVCWKWIMGKRHPPGRGEIRGFCWTSCNVKFQEKVLVNA